MGPADKQQAHITIVVVTGMSGSGRSTAINALEDEGYYCIDNLPTSLVPGFVELCSRSEGGMNKVALGLDLRDLSYTDDWPTVRHELEQAGHDLSVVFVDAADAVLLRRYSETRRVHPLGEGRELGEAINTERGLLSDLRAKSRFVIDTSAMSVHDLKRRIRDLVSGRSDPAAMSVTLKSFGYKYGPVLEADLVFDVRFLPNPYFVDQLRGGTGLDAEVANYVLDRPDSKEFVTRIHSLLEFLLPRYAREGRAYLTIAVGCTGGRHRSVAIAESIGQLLSNGDFQLLVRHRDIEREQ